jgi:putative DNA primase/helicase
MRPKGAIYETKQPKSEKEPFIMGSLSELVTKVQTDILNRYGESVGEIQFNTPSPSRWPKCASWAWGSEWEFKGKVYASITYGSWKHPDGTHRIDSFEKTQLKNKAFYKDFQERQERKLKEMQELTKKKNDDCRSKWKPKFKIADSEMLHEYLIDKGIEKPFGSRVDTNNVLMVPVYDHEGFNGVQRIYFNPEIDSYEKRFASGIKIKGSFFPLQKFKFAELIYVTEGFATACSIQTAYPKIPVLTVFNAGNIIPAIENIRKVNPSCKIVICADRDSESNTGEIYARKATKKFSSCIYKMPKFKRDNKAWTDYNDLHQFEGLKAVKDQLRVVPKDFYTVVCLGYDRNKFYLMSTQNTQVNSIAGHNLTEKHLYNLIPSSHFWMSHYPKFDKDDENKENPIGIDWTWAGNDIREKCLEKGIFDWSNIRTSGVWEDSGTFYFHNGQTLYDGKNYIDVFSANLSKHYEAGKSCYSIDRKMQLSQDERESLFKLFTTISTKTTEQGLLILGWCFTAPIAGALPWRPHLWITGQSSAGKSWTMENIISKLLEGFSIFAQGESTEAGIRQKVGNQSTPIIFDEFEIDDERSKEKRTAVIQLARQASTPSTGDILKGSADGTATTFSPNFSICVSSINLGLIHKQDRNRFTVVEFSDERASNEQFKEVKQIQEEIMDHEISRKLVSYCFHNIDILIKNYLAVEEYLKSKRYKGHFCRQYATLIAGVMLCYDPIEFDEESLPNFIESNFTISEWFEKTGDEDNTQLREYVLASFIRVHNEPMTIAEIANHAINSNDEHCIFQKTLSRYGMRVGENCIYIKKGSNKNFSELLQKTKWGSNWEVALQRVEGVQFDNKKTKRFNGKPSKFFKMEL